MKKKIFFMSHAMFLGGAETALIGLLESIDYAKYDVDLFLLKHSGDMMEAIPKDVNLLPENQLYSMIMSGMKDVLISGHLKIFTHRLYSKVAAKRYDKKNNATGKSSAVALEYIHKYTYKILPQISCEYYDLAVSFLTPHYYVANHVNAKLKIAWIHTDYKKIFVNRVSELKMWSYYDRIISISEDVSKSFISVFPELKDKLLIIENILPNNYILRRAAEFDCSEEIKEKDIISILSIGRFSEAKNFDNVPEICSLILKNGVNVKWYLIGYGSEEDLIRAKIKEFKMEDHVIILGKKENPYPYIKACDVYIQPSRYEGKSVAVREAQLLGKPVIITNYETANSQLQNGYDGLIVPMDNKKCANEITKTLRNKVFLVTLSNNCKNHTYSNFNEIEELYKVINEMSEQ